MDNRGFDELTRRLAAGQSRRSLLSGLIGGGMALIAAKAGTTLAAPAAKVDVCHWDDETATYEWINISENGWVNGHSGQHEQDFLRTDCCTASDCGAPANATALCTKAGCDFVCNEGYQRNEAGDACVAISLCAPGFEPVNGGCFEITGIGQTNCNAGCSTGYGNVEGSGQYLCGTETGGTCTSNANCDPGQACTFAYGPGNGRCIAAC